MHSPPFSIRNARPDEAKDLSELCMRSKAHWGYDPEFLEQCRASLTLTPERLIHHPARVAQNKNGVPMGLASFTLDPDCAKAQAEIELLFVEPDCMGMGIGRALLEDLRAILRAKGCRQLWVLSDPGAESFYRKQGAQRIALRPSDCIPDRSLPWLCIQLESDSPASQAPSA